MGAWGIGLYSSDMAADMRSLIKSALRLPFDEDRIVQVICEREPGSANDPNDPDHTIFWLVLADQFAKRGVAHAATRAKALTIIERGDDLAMMEKLGMTVADRRKRGAKLDELRARLLAAPTVSKPRATLKSPQPYVFELGVLYACPVLASAAINPYIGKKRLDGSPWTPDGWRQFVILERGRAFDYLTWYQAIVTKRPVAEKPRLEEARADWWWKIETPKTCSPRHFKIMEIEPIGDLPIDMDRAYARFPKSKPGTVFLGWGGVSAAVDDITIGNTMCSSIYDWDSWYVRKGCLPMEDTTMMKSLSDILVDGL